MKNTESYAHNNKMNKLNRLKKKSVTKACMGVDLNMMIRRAKFDLNFNGGEGRI